MCAFHGKHSMSLKISEQGSVGPTITSTRESSLQYFRSVATLVGRRYVTYVASPFHQLIPGHEVVGEVVDIGKNVTGFDKGDRCVADPTTVVCSLQRGISALHAHRCEVR